MNCPLISVFVPVYKTAVYLPKCMDSLLGQTYPNLEIILVDDGSPDNCPTLCDDYAAKNSRIKVIHQKNAGPSAARNAGIKVASGELIGFVDSDDYCTLNMYEVLFNLMSSCQADIAVANYYRVTSTGIHFTPLSFSEKVLEPEEAILSTLDILASFAWNKLYKKELFTDIEFPAGQLVEDLSTCYKLYDKANKVVATNERVYYYNELNATSLTKSSFLLKKLDYFIASDENLAYCRQKGYLQAEKRLAQERMYHIAGFMRQMALAGFNDPAVIVPFIRELRLGIGSLLRSSHVWSNKCFAVALCLHWRLAFAICRRYGGKK